MYYFYRDGDIVLVLNYCMCSQNNLMGRVLKSNSTEYVEGKAYTVCIHESSDIYRYNTLDQLLEEHFSEFV